eukprot:TRINITY_DN1581_c0_g2_i1.p3 TRINITY_DN1581_c0_g2~~TRINITY_DN1581_c0_g2_i1.p3  ORF type:complete len:646 (-),score=129.95 TRINITY_DN1581_c0_g2_i1:7338-9275(-)
MQAILMDRVLKFFPREEPRPQSKSNAEMEETLKTQLQEKTLLLEQCNNLEQENIDCKEKLVKKRAKYKTLKKEYEQINIELIETKKSFMGANPHELEMQNEIDSLREECRKLKQEVTKLEKSRDLLLKVENEVLEMEQKLRRSQEVAEQGRKKMNALIAENNRLKKNVELVSEIADKVKLLEKEKGELEILYQDTNESLQMQDKLISELTEKNERLADEKNKLEEALASTKQKEKFWKQRTNQLISESREASPKENLSPKETRDFELETKEAYYQHEIQALQRKIDQMVRENAAAMNTCTLELNKKIEVLIGEKEKMLEQLAVESKVRAELEKVNEELQAEVEGIADEKHAFAEIMKELQRTKKDRETLLEISERAQSTLKEVDTLKAEIKDQTTKNAELEKCITSLGEEKKEIEGQLKKARDNQMELERKLAGSEGKIIFLKEERKKMEIQKTDHSVHIVSKKQQEKTQGVEKRIADQLAAQKELLKSRHKAKREALQEVIKEKSAIIAQKDSEINSLKKCIDDRRSFNKEEYEHKISILYKKLSDAHANAKRIIGDMENAHQREQRLMSSAIYELGMLLNKSDKSETPGISYKVLAKLANRVEVKKGLTILSGNTLNLTEQLSFTKHNEMLLALECNDFGQAQ